jgi:hypothetical protein
MASHVHGHDPGPNDIERGYEGNNISVRGMIVFVAAFVVAAAVIHTIIWLVLVGMQERQRAENTQRFPPPLFSESMMDVVRRPPPPNLQPSPAHDRVAWRDMDDLRREQEGSLTRIKPEQGRGWEPAYTDVVREPSQPLNQLRLPNDAAESVAPRITASRSGAPASQPATRPAETAERGAEGAGR